MTNKKLTVLLWDISLVLVFIVLMVGLSAAYGGDLQNPLTVPGVVAPDMTLEKVCNTKWGEDERFVTPRMKKFVLARDGFDINSCPDSMFKGQKVKRSELDHLISRELGGADDVANLWYQCYEMVPVDKTWQRNGAHKKDELENKLHKMVCAKPQEMELEEAQNCLATDWVKCYEKVIEDENQNN